MTAVQNVLDTRNITPLDDTSAPAGVARLLPLGMFFLLSAALAWTVWLWPLKAQGSFTLFVLGSQFKFLLVKLVIGNCMPGILAVIWALSEGKNEFRRMLSTLTKWRVPLKWYMLAVALPCGVSLAALGAVLFYFTPAPSFPPATDFFRVLLMTLPFGPLWEELAWRAFALRKLESRYSRLIAALILGAYWGLWHVPLWLLQLNGMPVNKVSFVLTAMVDLIAWSIIWAYLYHRSSDSLPVVILLHAAYGAATTQAAYVFPQLNMYVIFVTTAVSVCLAVAFAKALVGEQGFHSARVNA
jgi:membrane protease YdiL (CAAX protease family)